MILDTSAIIAILVSEPERDSFTTAIAGANQCFVSAGTWIELNVVLARRYDEAMLDAFHKVIDAFGVTISPVDADQAKIGGDAFHRFGRGTRIGHKARLNFGDCFAYALAKATGEPLLFKGDDFSKTDVTPALPA